MRKFGWRLLLTGVLVSGCLFLKNPSEGRNFRNFDVIRTPEKQDVSRTTRAPSADVPVPRSLVLESVRRIIRAWNRGNLREVLSDNFYDAPRLQAALEREVPRDARLRLMSLRSFDVLEQKFGEMHEDGSITVRSKLTVEVHTQLEFDDPDQGFQRREGINELLLSVAYKIHPRFGQTR